MEQLDNRQTELFWELLAHPADKSYKHVQNLRRLVSEYPQSGLLQSMLVYAGEDDNIGHAIAYTDPRLLYKLRNNVGGLLSVSDEQLIKTIGEKRFFHTDDDVPEPEVATPLMDADKRQQSLIDEYQPSNHFFKPESEEETIAEPEKLDDLLRYGDEVTTGEHELIPPVTEFHHPEQHEAVSAQPSEVEEDANVPQENVSLPEQIIPAHEEEHPIAGIAINEEPVIEQQIPLEDTKPEPPIEQEIQLPTLGFYVPGIENADEESYTGGDIASKLYESYAQTFEHVPQPESHPIEDEVFDEIVGIDDINVSLPGSFSVSKDEVPQSPQPIDENTEPTLGFQVPSDKETGAATNRKVDLSDEAEKLMLSNIATTDFFVFDQALSERIKSGDEGKEAAATAALPQSQPVATVPDPQNAETIKESGPKKIDYQRVAKYFDEKMPYSFMWWLDKTRKEHSGIYQPYVTFQLDTSQQIETNVPDELQHQYYENIFQLTSVDDLERTTGTEPVVFDTRKKEDEIIERFIHDAPQIKPQVGEKLDSENKAKRSSEDQDEIVTETLAHVYADQMLYHKAIKVYQKLMLKFPEKRRYFASQIEQLEKKIS